VVVEEFSTGSECREVLYAGHVQGVGFRYTAQHVARLYRITGYVRNLSDGRVELVVEGERSEIEGFLQDISARMGHYIRSMTEKKRPATHVYSDFRICF
jgi:acylphosphatase